MTRSLVVFSAVLALVFVACGEGQDNTPAPAAPPPVARKAVVDAGVLTNSSGAAEPYQYSYVAMAKRDPFRSLLGADPGPREANDKAGIEACDEPLCQVDLDDLHLVAVVSGDANPVAMVEDRGGIGHVVRRNTKIGRQAGKVTSILRDCIVVTSFVVGPDGRAQPNRQNLCVSPEGRGGGTPILDLMNGKTRE